MLLLTLFFFWISTKTKGAAHWITLIISLISLWTTGKTAYNWYNAKSFLDKNLMDTCDAPAPAEPVAKTVSASAPVAKTVASAPVAVSKTA
jgi:cell division protein FtsW (lipid II flippase)